MEKYAIMKGIENTANRKLRVAVGWLSKNLMINDLPTEGDMNYTKDVAFWVSAYKN